MVRLNGIVTEGSFEALADISGEKCFLSEERISKENSIIIAINGKSYLVSKEIGILLKKEKSLYAKIICPLTEEPKHLICLKRGNAFVGIDSQGRGNKTARLLEEGTKSRICLKLKEACDKVLDQLEEIEENITNRITKKRPIDQQMKEFIYLLGQVTKKSFQYSATVANAIIEASSYISIKAKAEQADLSLVSKKMKLLKKIDRYDDKLRQIRLYPNSTYLYREVSHRLNHFNYTGAVSFLKKQYASNDLIDEAERVVRIWNDSESLKNIQQEKTEELLLQGFTNLEMDGLEVSRTDYMKVIRLFHKALACYKVEEAQKFLLHIAQFAENFTKLFSKKWYYSDRIEEAKDTIGNNITLKNMLDTIEGCIYTKNNYCHGKSLNINGESFFGINEARNEIAHLDKGVSMDRLMKKCKYLFINLENEQYSDLLEKWKGWLNYSENIFESLTSRVKNKLI